MHSPQDWEDVCTVMFDRESRQFRIRIAVVVALERGSRVSCSDAGAINAQIHFRRVEEFVQQLLAKRTLQLTDYIASCIRKTAPESENFLEPIAWDQLECIRGGGFRSCTPLKRARLREPPLRVRRPYGNF